MLENFRKKSLKNKICDYKGRRVRVHQTERDRDIDCIWRKEHNGRKEGAKSEALSEFRTISILYSTFCLKK